MANEWNTSYPLDHTLISGVPGEIRALKASVKTQLDRSHETPVDGDATGSEHSSGSGVAYEGTGTPTNRPDGVTALGDNAIDRGRLWLDDNYDPPQTKRWDGSAFERVWGGFMDGAGAVMGKFDGSATAHVTSANTWEDLDSGLGYQALVLLEVKMASAVTGAIKPKGYGSATATQHWGLGYGSGTGTFSTSSSPKYVYLMMMTDSSGILQIASDSSADLLTIKLMGYVK